MIVHPKVATETLLILLNDTINFEFWQNIAEKWDYFLNSYYSISFFAKKSVQAQSGNADMTIWNAETTKM